MRNQIKGALVRGLAGTETEGGPMSGILLESLECLVEGEQRG